MLDLHRLRLLHELHARGTIAAVADALQFTPSAVSQQLAVLEREAGAAAARAGRARRAADRRRARPGRSRRRAARAGRARARPSWPRPRARVAGRGRIASFQSVALRLAVPAMQALAREAPDLRCELVEAEPEQSLPALALGDVDLVLADEWQHQPHARPAGVDREDLLPRPGAPRAARGPSGGAASPRRGAAGRAGRRGVDDRPPRHRLGGDDEPDVPRARRLRPRHPPPHQRQRHEPGARRRRAGRDAAARASCAPRPTRASPCRRIAEGSVHRTIFTATRAADAERPSVQALLAAVRAAAARLGWPAPGDPAA